MMFKNRKLQTKLLVLGCLLTVIPLLIVSTVVLIQNRKMLHTAETESTRLAYADLDHIAEAVYAMAASHQEVTEKNIQSALNVAREVVAAKESIFFHDEKVRWNAINQFTKAVTSLELPRMMVGNTWFGQVRDPEKPVPVVDHVRDLLGVTCTVFQRMNEKGDMLRIATNVIKKDGTRAIGTFIPAVNPDEKPNPVISTVLKGQTFNGRAFVVNAWYITAYEPIYDVNKKITGVLYVGIPQENVQSLRQAVMNIRVGKTGYVYVLDSQGHYVISKDGKRDGENIWEAKDSDGNSFIQEICRKALTLGPGEIAEQRYPWKNAVDKEARMKVARIKYFQPWDWIIGAGSYMDEFLEAPQTLKRLGDQGNLIVFVVFCVSLIAAILAWWLTARGIARPIHRVIEGLNEGAEQVASGSGQVSSASQALAEGASEQASSLEETSSSLEEMSSMTKQNADHAQQANNLMKEANQVIHEANESMTQLTTSMEEISRASEETSKIIKTIDEIAFQTNLLALNAAVEAARAGEAGSGFAVVADEVRNLAMRAADAARNTSNLIEDTVKKIGTGSGLVMGTNEAFSAVAGSASKVGELVAEIAAASHEQAQGIEQINTAVAEADKVTQQNAANAEESASASEEMNAQAEHIKEMVVGLIALVGGGAKQMRGRETGLHTGAKAVIKRSRLTVEKEEKIANRPPGSQREIDPDKVIPMDEKGFRDF
jgi:methyl-accepting chemotaxis protein